MSTRRVSSRAPRRVGCLLTLALAPNVLVGCAMGGAQYARSAPMPVAASPTTESVAQSEATASGGEAGDSDGSLAPSTPSAPSMNGPSAGMPGGSPPPPQPAPARTAPTNTGGRGPAGNTSQPVDRTAGAQPAAPANVPAPMLIYTAVIDLQSERGQVVATLDRIAEAATAMGGYLIRRTDTSVQVRVPSARFREGLRQLETFGEVLHRSISADDVSEEFHDMEVRLQNLRAVRQRLEAFLARAANMQEALSVERELERITREIDTIEGRMRFLRARVAFSLVTVNVRERPAEGVIIAAPPPPRRLLELPVEWLSRLGLNNLLNVREP